MVVGGVMVGRRAKVKLSSGKRWDLVTTALMVQYSEEYSLIIIIGVDGVTGKVNAPRFRGGNTFLLRTMRE